MPSLTSQQLETIQALSSGRSVTATADALGIHRTTLHHWSRTIPEFRDTLDAVKQARIDATRDEMHSLNEPSLAILRHALEDPSTSPSLRLRTALAIIKFNSTPEKNTLPKTNGSDLDLFAIGYLAGHTAGKQHADSGHNIAFDRNHNLVRPEPAPDLEIHHNSSLSTLDETDESAAATGPAKQRQTPRNAPCPCGSGNKFKRCCGKDAPPVLSRAA